MSDLEQLTHVIAAILSNDNQARIDGESLLANLRKQNFNEYVQVFCNLFHASNEKTVRLFCAVHLRRILSNYVDIAQNSRWHELTNDNQKFVKEALIELLQKESDGPTRRILCDLIGELYVTIKKLDEDKKKNMGEEGTHWNNLMESIQNFLASGETVLIEAALKILGILFMYCGQDFVEHKTELFAILKGSLEHQDPKVKVGAIEAISNFLGTINSNDIKLFVDLIPLVTDSLIPIINANEDLGADVLNDIYDIVDTEPKILKKHLIPFLNTIREISSMNVTIDSIKSTALEIIVHTFQMLPISVKNMPQVIREAFETTFAYMVSNTEDIDQDWMTPPEGFVESNEDSNSHDSAVRHGIYVLDRILNILGTKAAIPIFSGVMGELAKVDDWKCRYAAVMGLSQVGEYVTNMEELDHIVNFALKFLKDEHPKVRYGVLHCIGQIAEDAKPHFQTRYTEKIMPALIEVFEDNVPRVVSHSLAAMANFLEGCQKKSVTNYLQKILGACMNFLQNGITLIKENTISVIATTAEVSQTDFIPYWEDVAQVIFGILKDNTRAEYKQIRGQAVECLVIIGDSVGKAEFSKGAHNIIEIMINIQKDYNEDIDPQRVYILTGWQKICLALKEDFAPYLEEVLPSLFDMIDSIIFSYKNKQREKNKPNDAKDVMQALKGSDRPNILHAANTNESQEISTVVKMINIFILEMRKHFAPYLEKTSDILTYLLERSNNTTVKFSSARGLPGLLRVVQESEIDHKQGILRKMANEYMQLLWKCIDNEYDPEVKQVYVMCLREVLKHAGPFMDQQEVNDLSEKIFLELKSSDEAKLENSQFLAEQGEDIDEVEEASIKEENAHEEDLHCALAEVIGGIFEHHKQLSLPLAEIVFQKMLPNIMRSNMSVKMYKFGIFLIDNLIQYMGDDLPAEKLLFLGGYVIKLSSYPKAEVRHPASYGVGLLAQKAGANFQSVAELAVKALVAGLQVDKDEAESASLHGNATDNLIAAIGKILKYQSQYVDAKELTQFWFKQLPLRYDKKESREQTDLLMDIITNSDPTLIFGERGENLARVIHLFALLVNTKFVSNTFGEKVGQVIQVLAEKEETNGLLKEAITKLTEPLQKKLKDFLGEGN